MRPDYEPEHFGSVRHMLRPGNLTFDIGAYDATTSILIADKVGPENVVLIEPAEANWANIKQNWEKEISIRPRATFAGFVDAVDKPGSENLVFHRTFPPESKSKILDEKNLEFRWLHYIDVDKGVADRPRLTIDTLTRLIGPPRGITMDIEGAELRALKGATVTLTSFQPYVWISVHPQFMKERFNDDAEDLHTFMAKLGYINKILKIDHEEHWFYFPWVVVS